MFSNENVQLINIAKQLQRIADALEDINNNMEREL